MLTVRTWWDYSAPGDNVSTNYEAGVLYATAAELGFAPEQVQLDVVEPTGTDNDFIIADQPPFDLGMSQISVTEARAEVVDFADSYYDTEQVVIAAPDLPAADAATVGNLSSAALGVFDETASIARGVSRSYVDNVIQPTIEPTEYPSLWTDVGIAQTALEQGDIDALVIDLPGGLYALSPPGGLSYGEIVSVLPRLDQPFEPIAMMLGKGNPLVECVDLALAKLTDDGTLDALQEEWLHDGGRVPILGG